MWSDSGQQNTRRYLPEASRKDRIFPALLEEPTEKMGSLPLGSQPSGETSRHFRLSTRQQRHHSTALLLLSFLLLGTAPDHLGTRELTSHCELLSLPDPVRSCHFSLLNIPTLSHFLFKSTPHFPYFGSPPRLTRSVSELPN